MMEDMEHRSRVILPRATLRKAILRKATCRKVIHHRSSSTHLRTMVTHPAHHNLSTATDNRRLRLNSMAAAMHRRLQPLRSKDTATELHHHSNGIHP